MTDQPAQEPTMEEILASIRRIISEDEAPAETPAAAAAEPQAAPEPEPQRAPAPAETIFAAQPEPVAEAEPEPAAAEEDVLELTELYEAPPAAESIGDLDVVEAVEEAPAATEPAPAASSGYDALVGESAAASAASAFAGLAASFKKPEAAPAPAGGDMSFVSGNTVEAMVAEMLRPLLKDWLDNNLPGIVQAAVQREVERIARSA